MTMEHNINSSVMNHLITRSYTGASRCICMYTLALCFYIYRGIRYGNRRFIERTLYDNKTYTHRERDIGRVVQWI